MAPLRAAAVLPLATRTACLQCRRTFAQQHSPAREALTSRPRPNTIRTTTASVRWFSASSSRPKNYDYRQMQQLSESPTPERIIIDVREPAEYEAGYIPTSINIPIKSAPDAWFLPDEEFEDRFGFQKPPKDAEMVIYCRAGVRASAAAQLAQQNGYTNVSEYRGSWLDWEKNGGKAVKP